MPQRGQPVGGRPQQRIVADPDLVEHKLGRLAAVMQGPRGQREAEAAGVHQKQGHVRYGFRIMRQPRGDDEPVCARRAQYHRLAPIQQIAVRGRSGLRRDNLGIPERRRFAIGQCNALRTVRQHW
ncbi:hypothetical protein D3C81_1530550 [compost metagenome]